MSNDMVAEHQYRPHNPFLRKTAAIAAVVAGTIIVLVLYGRVFAGTVKQRLPSPDGRAIAEYRVYVSVPATDAAQSAVRIGTRFNPFRHTVFAGANYGADVTISWTDSKTLLIRCDKCDNLPHDTMEHTWNDISVRYDMQ